MLNRSALIAAICLAAGAAAAAEVEAPRKSTAERASAPFFHRTFLPDETREIRLYTMGGKDHVVVEGAAKGAITLRVISPPGTSKITEDDGVLAPAVYGALCPEGAPSSAAALSETRPARRAAQAIRNASRLGSRFVVLSAAHL